MEAAAHPSRVPSPSSVGFHRPRRRLLPMRMMRYAVYACAIGYALTGCMACCLKVFRARRAQTRRRAAFTFHRARRSLASCARARRHGHLCAPRVHRAGAQLTRGILSCMREPTELARRASALSRLDISSTRSSRRSRLASLTRITCTRSTPPRHGVVRHVGCAASFAALCAVRARL